ncbi:MAG: 4-(cytidine 5'-diphospho)-2-C-methyl-D-erythritol kinase [Oscillospiraceae bacterium]|nr:4-(cytidine 5'-diphospho)-2-C-methyl-D-erythritol kinase [Oscillospiraceae bacterium]
MNSISIKAPAKLNLFLDITGRLPNGYHEIASVMQTVDLFDYVKIKKADEITVRCSKSSLDGKSNIAYKAASLFFEAANIESGADIYIDKRIPSKAGMAGGSADAAAVLYGLNRIFDEPFSMEELCTIGAKCGADVPFSIIGGTMLAEGIGEKLSSVSALPDCWFVIVKPNFGMSTPESYKYYDEHGLSALEHPDKDKFIENFDKSDLFAIASGMYNVLEHTVKNPLIGEIKSVLKSLGAMGSMMTGSGTAVFGMFDSIEKAVLAMNSVPEEFGSVYLARPTNYGVSLDKSAAVYDKFEELGINYERVDHPTVYTMDEMDALGIFNKGVVGKNLFLRDNKGKRHFLVFVFGTKHADLEAIQNELGIKHVSFGSAERLDKYLGLTKGSVSPLGVINDKTASVEFIIDKEFADYPCVGVHPNQNTSTVWLSFEDLMKVIKENGNKIDFIKI